GRSVDTPKLFASIDLGPLGADEQIIDLPIYFRHLSQPIGPVRQLYRTCVAGLTIERGNLNSLEQSLDLYLGALVHFGRLPDFLFQVGQRAWPIYRLPDQLVTRYPGSPVFSGSSIGQLRVALADYFKITGLIQQRKQVAILHLSRADLQLYAPLCVLRAPGLYDVPVFPVRNERGSLLVAPVNSDTIQVPLTGAVSLLKLHATAADYLLKKGRIDSPWALTVRKMAPPIWHGLQAVLTPAKRVLAYHHQQDRRLIKRQLPVLANGSVLVAGRTNHLGRTAIHIAPDIYELQSRVGQELYAEGKLPSPSYVTLGRAKPSETELATTLEGVSVS
ncbi:MAG: hypothetical protein R3300_18860, partial [Candidatus Promineifilaceae bacterium]|nr:hypothetical protein [Candidatus Promineifilaceae bacterium]